MKTTTLCFLIKENSGNTEVCLAKKKRGGAKGKWNGFGGKVGDKVKGETIREGLIREGKEEFGIEVENPTKIAEVKFTFDDSKNAFDNYCHVFLSTEWKGDPTESEEMAPDWFALEKIPWNKMWESDVVYLKPLLTENKFLKAEIVFINNETFNLNRSTLEWFDENPFPAML